MSKRLKVFFFGDFNKTRTKWGLVIRFSSSDHQMICHSKIPLLVGLLFPWNFQRKDF